MAMSQLVGFSDRIYSNIYVLYHSKNRRGADVVQQEGARPSASGGLGSIPSNVGSNLRFAHLRYEGCRRVPVLETSVPRNNLHEKAKEREGSGEWVRCTESRLCCVHRHDGGGHI